MWNIGEVKVGRTKEYKYLGCMLSEDGCARANEYECVRGIWKYVAVPSTMFGMNVMAWNGGDLEKLEVLENRVVCLTLGTPKWTAVEVRGGFRVESISERTVNAVLNYKVRIEEIENKSWVKQIFEWRVSESLWKKICWGMQEN
ncbi:hypothetical protein FHG87_015949 [Trinorchestia longiramus]|nr:hypothetical protein FHG87_015949 [Trinorchestia longiramus]